MQHKVSVIIPVFNGEKYIEKAIRSVLAESCIGEVIIIDDGSTDNSFNIAYSIASANQLVKIFHHEGRVNKGPSATRNLGIKHASHEFIQFLDVDDEIISNSIQRKIDLMINTKADLLIGAYHIFNNNELLLKIPNKSNLWIGLFTSNIGHSSSNMWRKSFLYEIGFYDSNWPVSEDSELIFRALKNSLNIVRDLIPSAIYKIRKGSLSQISKNGLFFQINLRYLVGDYLHSTGNLTLRLNYILHVYMYRKLKKMKRLGPYNEYVELNDQFKSSEWYSKFLLLLIKLKR